jgi:polysaccharide pyruvyl transferase WcaK-like protein
VTGHQHVAIWGSNAHGNLGDRLLLDAAATIVLAATGKRAKFVYARGSGAAAKNVTTYRALPALNLLRCAGFVVAGGTHVHDRGSFGMTAAPFRPLLAAVALGTPSVMLSIGLEAEPAADSVVARLAEVCSLVTARDDDSFSRLQRHYPQVRRTRDLVEEALAAGASNGHSTAEKKYIAFAPSADLLTRSVPAQERDRLFTRWVQRITDEAETNAAKPLILTSSDQDHIWARTLAPEVEARPLEGLDLDTARAALRDVAHLYSMRFHVAVLARSLAVPVTAIGDDPKLRSLRSLDDDGVTPALAGEVLSSNDLVHALQAALTTPPTARQRVQAVIILTRVSASLVHRAAMKRRPRLQFGQR